MKQTHRLKPTELVKWKPEQEPMLARCVQAFMSILVVGTDGKVTTTQGFKLDAYLKIFTQTLELHEIWAIDVKWGLLYRTLFRLKTRNRQDLEMFRLILAVEVRRYLRRPIQEYWILFPLHVAHGQLARCHSFRILETKIYCRSWKYVRGHFEFEKFSRDFYQQMIGVTLSLEADFTPIMIGVEGRNSREAFDLADRSFELFRSLLNMVPHFGRSTHRWGGYPEPLGKILPPPVYGVFKPNGKYDEYLYNTKKYEAYERNTVSLEHMRSARKLAGLLRPARSEDDTIRIIIEALEKYGQVLDTTEWRLAFMMLWQILELVTLQSAEEGSTKNKNVVNRICLFLRQDQFIRDLLSVLYETRNSLVHRGRFPDEQGLEEVNRIKYIAEQMINALFAWLRVLPTKGSLARYYELASANNADLADRQRVVAAIRRKRAHARK